ncbi:hypothetical protein ACS0TY_012596 [Phlomoides rotata]
MEGFSRKEEGCHQFLDLIGVSEEKKLELRLAPPGEEDWVIKKRNISTKRDHNHDHESLLSFPQNPWKKHQENKTFSPANTPLPNTQKRTAAAPLVGWPPVRSFRKNLPTGSSSKPENKDSESKPKQDSPKTTLFVKINMDGIPIGRKVDLKAYDGYEKLSLSVDELFRGLLAAQSEGGKVIEGLLGNKEYTLVYEDNEGDRMLVGDVPWE